MTRMPNLQKSSQLEGIYDREFKIVFEAILQLMTPTLSNAKQIGSRPKTLK